MKVKKGDIYINNRLTLKPECKISWANGTAISLEIVKHKGSYFIEDIKDFKTDYIKKEDEIILN